VHAEVLVADVHVADVHMLHMYTYETVAVRPSFSANAAKSSFYLQDSEIPVVSSIICCRCLRSTATDWNILACLNFCPRALFPSFQVRHATALHATSHRDDGISCSPADKSRLPCPCAVSPDESTDCRCTPHCIASPQSYAGGSGTAQQGRCTGREVCM
jgi:hypothetical protein